ncbi:MAG: reactive intermediate/imine deaminase [candidate division Zixibacteria bacterium RBG_16_53_22]|nr:MAG: reactive intermediate/imine deaminase [candidate division Zixibacteria bacterium RBG_16_53_22]
MKKIIHTDRAPTALGPYNQAIIDAETGLLFTAGQIGIDPRSGELAGSDARGQAQQVFRNLRAVLEEAGCGFEDVLKSTIFLKNIDDFTPVNEVYAEHFIRDFPARSTVEVAKLPRNALVEIEFVARVSGAEYRRRKEFDK